MGLLVSLDSFLVLPSSVFPAGSFLARSWRMSVVDTRVVGMYHCDIVGRNPTMSLGRSLAASPCNSCRYPAIPEGVTGGLKARRTRAYTGGSGLAGRSFFGVEKGVGGTWRVNGASD